MRFRSGDDIVARIWASLQRRDHRGNRAATRQDPPSVPTTPAQISFYGRLGEMGHPEDRADDWPHADTGVRAIRPPVERDAA